MYIPFYPLGRPGTSRMRDALDEVLILSGMVDSARSIEPPLAVTEERPASRPSDEVVLKRFLVYAERATRYLSSDDEAFLTLPWRAGSGGRLPKILLSLVVLRLKGLAGGEAARHLIYIENAAAAVDFEKHMAQTGHLVGQLHQGGIWFTDFGHFFILSWLPTVAPKVLAARLGNMLKGVVLAAPPESQLSIPPPPSVPIGTSTRTAPPRTEPGPVPPSTSSYLFPASQRSRRPLVFPGGVL